MSTPEPDPPPDLLDELLRRTARAALLSLPMLSLPMLSLPMLSAHGYEVPPSGTVDRTARLLSVS